jgi:hypothetical protein
MTRCSFACKFFGPVAGFWVFPVAEQMFSAKKKFRKKKNFEKKNFPAKNFFKIFFLENLGKPSPGPGDHFGTSPMSVSLKLAELRDKLHCSSSGSVF